MTVYLCKDDFESILCGVYDAWMSKKGHQNVSLALAENYEFRMFDEYQQVEVSLEKFEKVAIAIQQKVSLAVYRELYIASLSSHKEKADMIYRYLIVGFQYGEKIISMLQLKEVSAIFEMTRAIGNEAHVLLGFVRFSEIREGALVSIINPKNDVLPLIADHFSDRLSGEDWLIYDKDRQKALVHAKQQPWFLMKMESEQWQNIRKRSDEIQYQQLWRVFVDSITIKERNNPICQRSHLPLRFRPYMDEFMKSNNNK